MQKFLRPAEFYAARQPAVLETLVGSCVAVCLYNFQDRFGAMNHFLQPRPGGVGVVDPGTYGTTATGYIVEVALRMDGDRSHYRAYVFGGAAVLKTWQTDECIGELNVQAALETLRAARIWVAETQVGGTCGRRICFHTQTGQVECRFAGDIPRTKRSP